jgi:hypothetical protein
MPFAKAGAGLQLKVQSEFAGAKNRGQFIRPCQGREEKREEDMFRRVTRMDCICRDLLPWLTVMPVCSESGEQGQNPSCQRPVFARQDARLFIALPLALPCL